MKIISTIASLLLITASAVFICNSKKPKPSYEPPDGLVPNGEVAAQIADAIWNPIYGKNVIEAEKPFRVYLENGVWIVRGAPLPKGAFGGVAIAEISKKDGKIIRVSHGQ